MPAAAADAPTGSHHVLAMKKPVLISVISQMTMRSTRPIRRDLPSKIPGLPTATTHGIAEIKTVGPRTVGSLSQLLSSASDFLHPPFILLASDSWRKRTQVPSADSQTRIDERLPFH